MGAIVSFVKFIYEEKEKIILGILILAFVGVAFVQIRSKKKNDSNNGGGKSPEQLVRGNWTPKARRKPQSYNVPAVTSPFPLTKYYELFSNRNIFGRPQKDKAGETVGVKKPEWANIRVKSVFDPTHSGNYIAIIEVNKRSRIVREGQLFEGHEVLRIDGVRNCLTIGRRDLKDEKEFCKEE